MTWLLYQWTRRFGSFITWCSLCALIDTQRSSLDVYSVCLLTVSGIGAVVKVVGSHPCGWGSIPGNSCSFLIVSLTLCSPQAAHSVARFFFQIPVSRSQRHLDIAKVYCYLSAQEVTTNGINYFIVNYTKFAANKISQIVVLTNQRSLFQRKKISVHIFFRKTARHLVQND